ncbi:DUF456 domain-containing protein [Nocardioides sp.]|uniref:DUF456 domain-containing protein n=1 Tax=Nocardioides sp. TaxID=35761 RepID=UPI00260E856A|nr:DUF456 domain-containing protein [Nocardioides sp.]
MTGVEVLLLLTMLLGLCGIVALVVPGSLIIAAATVVWALQADDGRAWIFTSVALALLVAGMVVKYVVPGRRLADAGIPGRTQLIGLGVGVVGFFVIPVIGLVLGFVLGVWIAEVVRLGAGEATSSTFVALKAAGLSLLIELSVAALAVAVTLTGMVVVT